MTAQLEKTQRVGPKVRVDVQYQCNGCTYHSMTDDECEDNGRKVVISHHTCNHPSVIDEFTCPQWMGGGEGQTIYHIAKTPTYLCPYIKDSK